VKAPLIEFEDFGFQYHAQAKPTLYGINLTSGQGEKILIAGASGSGKSTMGNCINGLIPFSYPGEFSGKLRVGGLAPKEAGIFELSKIVGTVLQDPDGQFVGLTVGEDIAFALENDCVAQDAMFARVTEAAGLVGIDAHLSQQPHALSGGQKQRVSIAGVLVDNVRALLFDEPLANLDPASGKRTVELIDTLRLQKDITVIIIEHRLEDVLWREVDRIVLMNDGRIAADLPPDDLLASGLLREHGIREPLYISALRYAGVEVTASHRPGSVKTLRLTEPETAKLREWQGGAKEAARPRGAPLLSIKGLSFEYTPGVGVLEDISFDLAKGEILAVLGNNGAGKSTLSKLICGFIKPAKGGIYLEGRDLAGGTIAERAMSIGYVMQNPNQMISKAMIFDEVALGLNAEERERVGETLKICGLYPFRHWPISALSFGQRKRVTIASILVRRPQIIILDEPTAGQDFRHYTEIMDFLLELNARGITIIMITHDMHLCLQYAPRALVIARGRLIADDTAAVILSDKEIIAEASLKETSLYTLAGICAIHSPAAFVQRFIDWENAPYVRT
jgi:energy-coupling factor transport system ATP-binding protein